MENQLQGYKNKTSRIENEYTLELAEEDFILLEKKFGIKITKEDIVSDPTSFLSRLGVYLNTKFGKLKYTESQIEAFFTVAKKSNPEQDLFYEGQENDKEKVKEKWIDDWEFKKDKYGNKYVKLSDYLEKISELKTNNGYHEYAKLLIEALKENDFMVSHIKSAPNLYGGGKWINMNPLLFTAKKDSKDFMEKLFYYYRNITGTELSFVHTLLHEATHAVTLNKINNPKTKEEIEARNTLYSIYKYVKSKAVEYKAEKFYGLTDLDEFCAEYYTSGSIRNLITKIEQEKPGEQFEHKMDYTEKMGKPQIKQDLHKIKRLFLKPNTSTKVHMADNLLEQIEQNIEKLVGAPLKYELKDDKVDSMVINTVLQLLVKSNK